jgi:GNAT superfamily N-acetyltransferase
MKIKVIDAQQTFQIRHEVMWPNAPLDYVKLDDDAKGLHYGAYVDGKLVSVVSLFINGAEAQFRKFATLHAYQGKGLGTALLKFVIKEAEGRGAMRIWCNARADKTDFYKKFGLVKTQSTFTKKGQDYVIMERVIQTSYTGL